jgi:tRNA(fMet)-specific endonuclease VapC
VQYLLDTNVCVDYLNGRHPNVTRRIHSLHPDDLCVSSIVAGELRYGADRSKRARFNYTRLDLLLSEVRTIAFDENAARVFGRVRSRLEAKGRPIGPYDMQIAAHALSLSLILVTDNIDEFTRVDGLKLENWR